MNLQFQKQGNDVWDMTATIDPADGTIIDGLVDQIQFSDDGSLQQAVGVGLGDPNIEIQFNGIAAPQVVQFAFGSANSFDGLTHLAADSFMAAKQNGFAPGALSSINVKFRWDDRRHRVQWSHVSDRAVGDWRHFRTTRG